MRKERGTKMTQNWKKDKTWVEKNLRSGIY